MHIYFRIKQEDNGYTYVIDFAFQNEEANDYTSNSNKDNC